MHIGLQNAAYCIAKPIVLQRKSMDIAVQKHSFCAIKARNRGRKSIFRTKEMRRKTVVLSRTSNCDELNYYPQSLIFVIHIQRKYKEMATIGVSYKHRRSFKKRRTNLLVTSSHV